MKNDKQIWQFKILMFLVVSKLLYHITSFAIIKVAN